MSGSRTRILYSPATGKKMAEFKNGELVWSSDEYGAPQSVSPYIQPDIQPYQSMHDGTWITSRSQHREHLKANRLIEVGNETKYLKHFKSGNMDSPPGLKETIIRATNEVLSRRR